MKHVAFAGRLVMLGCGSIGQGVLPLILRHVDMPRERIHILTADARGSDVAAACGVAVTVAPVTRDNYRDLLRPLLGGGDFLLNLSVDVSSVALIELCQEIGALVSRHVHRAVGRRLYRSLAHAVAAFELRAARERARAGAASSAAAPLRCVAHGANPGLVSHFVKRALLDIARDTGVDQAVPASRTAWAELAATLGAKVIHIAERDTQVANVAKRPGEFVNTWSIDGFTGEGCQPAELGWGTHERWWPADASRHEFGCDAAVYLQRPGAATRVRTWTPLEGPFHGFLVTHNESISIADYLTLREDGVVRYRPTVHYAYHPCDDAVLSLHEFAGKNWRLQDDKRLMMDEIVHGMDELGVLLMGHAKGAYWFGSRLTIEQARRLVPYNNATSLQVTAAVLAGLVWAIENPRAGIVEADEIDHERVLEIAGPYLGELVGVYGDWTPLRDRETLFPEQIDRADPWQFKNFRVV